MPKSVGFYKLPIFQQVLGFLLGLYLMKWAFIKNLDKYIRYTNFRIISSIYKHYGPPNFLLYNSVESRTPKANKQKKTKRNQKKQSH